MSSAIFGPDGPLAKKSRHYEIREGQIRMAEAVAEAIEDRAHLAVEAPCGIGKTYAYLVPALLHAAENDSRIVVCTANIALQEQIFGKDLPALKKILPEPFSYALIKGINNYLCLDRFEETREELLRVTFSAKELRHWKKIAAWRGETETGDVSDLDFEPADGVWNRVNGVSELCNASECRFCEDCFAMKARRRLRKAQVIVTNYHLFFAHLRVRAAGAGDVILPPHDIVICDEAHEMADIARDFFGLRLTPWSANALLRGANHMHWSDRASRLRSASRSFFERLRTLPVRRLRKEVALDGDDLLGAVGDYRGFLREARHATEEPELIDKIAKFSGAAQRYEEILRSFLGVSDDNMVYWIEKDARAARLLSRAIDVSAILGEELFRKTPSVILTSATLATEGRFDFVKRETGAEGARELSVPSPFDLRRQALLVVPRMKTVPNQQGFAQEVAAHLNRIIRLLGGRTLCLFTSYRNLESCAEAAEETGVTILRQGDKPRTKLLRKFRRDEGTALFATQSFWQGVDIPGEALSCLAIDKIPFMNPDDPLLEALQERDRECFTNYSLPKAVLDLRQGIGRLIRRQSDRGVVVLFDNRVFTKRYGHTILASLPECPVHRDLSALENFFKTAPAPVE